jgi:protein phosphatase
VREFFERLFSSNKKLESMPVAPEREAGQDQGAGDSEVAQGPGLLNNTVIMSSSDYIEQDHQAAGNVSDDTLPGKVSTENISTGLPVKEWISIGGQVVGLSAAQRCHIGNVRNRNEDSCFTFTAEFSGEEPLPPTGLYVVADGMGGHHAGHEASKNVARLVAQHILERIYVPLLRNSTASSSEPIEPIGEVMVDAVQTANHYIHDNDPKKSSGSTLTAALILGRRLYVAHVGDSRAYLLSEDELVLLTTDHSYVRRLQEAGQLTEEEAAVHPQRNMIYKAVGQGGDLDIDSFTRSLPRQGKLIVCSDGLWGLISEERLAQVLSQDIPLPDMTDELITMALRGGGHDNITAIVVSFNF